MSLHDLAFYFAVFFLAGIALASFNFSLFYTIGIVALAGMLFLIIFKRYALVFLIPAALLGFVYFQVYSDVFYKEQISFGESQIFKGVVSNEPVYGAKSQKLNIKLQEPHSGEVTVYLGSYPRYDYGDFLEFNGTLEKSPSGALNISAFPEVTFRGKNKGNFIKNALFKFKRGFVSNIERVLPQEQAALLSGESVGYRAGFSKEFTEDMKKSGTTHIVALSGHNISVVIFAVMFTLGSFFSRRVAFYGSIFFVILFVIMAGAEASVVRAGIMGILILLAVESSRLYSVRNALAFTALFMVLWNPRVLVFDIGFGLSFGALLGIVYLMPLLKHVLHVKDEGFMGWKYNALTTISAQLGVLPILLHNFGYFSLLSIVANVLILEVVPYTMGLGFLIGFLGFFSEVLSQITGYIAYLLLAYQIAIIGFFSKIDFAALYINNLPLTILFGYYIILGWLSWFFYKKYRLTPTL